MVLDGFYRLFRRFFIEVPVISPNYLETGTKKVYITIKNI